MARLTYEHVTKRFGGVTAIDDLLLEIRDGELIVLVGPSGCGKSTVLRVTAGLETVSEGDLYIDNRRVNDVPARDRDVAMVFQNYALYPHLSVYENLAFGLKVRGVTRSDTQARVRRAAEMLEIGGLLDRKPGQLSGGQRQRVAVGRAIVREPRVFLMDEPLSNLDAQLRVQTRGELIQLHRQLGTTTVYVTHDQVEAMTMGQRIAVLRGGVIQQLATPDVLYAQPANVFVAGFIGTPAMNLIPGELWHDTSDRSVFRGNELTIPVASMEFKDVAIPNGQQVVLGIRPEHVRSLHDARTSVIASMRGRVVLVEPIGGDAFVYLDHAGQNVTARFDTRYAPRLDEEVEVAIAADRVHLFDAATENALAHIDLQPIPATSA